MANDGQSADIQGVRTWYTRAAAVWNWRISAHLRLAWLASAWLLVMGMPVLGPLVAPLAALRFGGSIVQLVLNGSLARVQPLGPRPRSDWALLGLALIASSMAAALDPGPGIPTNPLLIAPVLVPISMIQLRACARAYRAANNGKADGNLSVMKSYGAHQPTGDRAPGSVAAAQA